MTTDTPHPRFTWLSGQEALDLAAEAEAAAADGHDPRVELRRRLNAIQEQRRRRIGEEWRG